MMNADEASLEKKGGKFQQYFTKLNIKTEIVKSEGQAGGGSLPEQRIPSFAVKIEIPAKSRKNKGEMAAKIFNQLLKKPYPVLGVLRKGDLIFDVLTIPEEDFEKTAGLISEIYKEVCNE